MTKREGHVWIGTSGWSYDHWKERFYPKEVHVKDFLHYYAERFKTAEVNNSFYKLPEAETLKHWRETVPEDFLFAVKASRYITHMKRLKDPADSTRKFFDVIPALGPALGPILFQLPPHFHRDADRLDAFLTVLPNDYRYVFEFRDESWFDEETYDVLHRHKAGFCIADIHGNQSPEKIIGDFAYIRLHGPSDKAYQGLYGAKNLVHWQKRIGEWQSQGHDVYCYFDNDQDAYATRDARTLADLIYEK